MAKLVSELTLELTPEQIEQATPLLEKLSESGGMILGSITRYRTGSPEFQGKVIVGCRLVALPTAERLVEIANANEEEK